MKKIYINVFNQKRRSRRILNKKPTVRFKNSRLWCDNYCCDNYNWKDYINNNSIEDFSSIADVVCRNNCKDENFILMMIHSMNWNSTNLTSNVRGVIIYCIIR